MHSVDAHAALIIAQRFVAIGKRVEAVRIATPTLDLLNDELLLAMEGERGLNPRIADLYAGDDATLRVLTATHLPHPALSSLQALGWNKYFQSDDQRTFIGSLVRAAKRYGVDDHPMDTDATSALGFLASLVVAHLQRSVAADLLVAVPSSAGSQNTLPAQVAAIAGGNRLIEVGDASTLYRHRTIEQVKLIVGAEARRHAIHGTMSAQSGRVQGRRVIVIDDLLESGATLGECARALQAAGASTVHALCLVKTRRYAREMMNT